MRKALANRIQTMTRDCFLYITECIQTIRVST